MPIDNKKLKNLYDAMRQEGYDQSYDEFRVAFLGNNNYANRKDIYDTMSSGGYNLGKTYAEFMTSMQVAPQQANKNAAAQAAAAKSAPTQPAKGGWRPNAEQMAGYQKFTDGVLRTVKNGDDVMNRVNTRVARAKRPNQQKVNLGFNNKHSLLGGGSQVQHEGKKFDAAKGDFVDQYSTEAGNVYDNTYEADAEQYNINRNKRDAETLDMVADIERQIREQEELLEKTRKASRDVEAPDNLWDAIRYTMSHADGPRLDQEDIDEEAIKAKITNLQNKRSLLLHGTSIGQKVGKSIGDQLAEVNRMIGDDIDNYYKRHPNGGPTLVSHDYHATGQYQINPYLDVAARSLEDAQEMFNEAGKSVGESGLTGFGKGVIRGFGSKLFDARTWDMGFTDIKGGLSLAEVLKKADEGKPLTVEQQKMLDAKATELACAAYFSGALGRGYKAGQVTAESIPFMLEFMLNPLSGTGRSAQAMLTRYALKRFGRKAAMELGEDAAKKILYGDIRQLTKSVFDKGLSKGARSLAAKTLAGKASARIAGDITGAAGMTFTTGQGRVVADMLNRATGQVNFGVDTDGKVKYTGHDAPEESSLLTAYGKAFGSQFSENYSEFMGPYISYVGGMFANGLKKIGGKYLFDGLSSLRNRSAAAVMKLPFAPMVSDFIREATKSDWAKVIKGMQKRAHWDGTAEEYLEEVAGNMLNAILVGDNDFSTEEGRGVFNLSDNIDTFLGVGLMSGAMSVSSAAGYRTPAYRARKMVENADARGEKLLGGSLWGKFRSSFDAAQSEQDKQVILTSLLQNSSLTDEGRRAVLQYARGKQFQQAVADGTFREMEEDAENGNEVERACRAEYTEGQNIDSVEEMRDAKTRYNVLLREALAVEPNAEMYSDPQFYEQSNPNATPEQKAAMRAYAEAKAQYEGVADRMKTDMADQQQKANEQVDRFKNQTDGLITRVRLRGSDAEFYVTSGHISLNNDGTINDAATSSNLTIVDGEGNQRFISRGDVVDVLAQNTPEETLEQLNDIIMNEAKAKADLIDGKLSFHAGDTFTILNNEGLEQKVTIAQDPSTMAMSAVIEGEQAAVPLTEDSMAKLQQMSDAYQESRFGKYRQEQQDAVANAENEATQEEATPTSPTVAQEEAGAPTEGRSYGYGESVSYVDGEGHTQEGVVHGKTPEGTYEVEFDNPPSGKNVVDEYTQEELDALVQPIPAGQTEEAIPEPTALERVPINEETGEPMFEKADSETALDALNEVTGGNEDNTTAIVRAQVEQATKALEALKKKKPSKKAPSLKGSPLAMVKAQQEAEANYNTAMEEYNAQVAAAEENLNAWSRINSLMNDRKRAIREQQEAERKAREEELHAEAVARLEEDKRIAAEKAAEQEAVGTHAVNPKIKAKWDGATKVEGNPNAITLADGSTIRGHYVLTEAGAATASHDVNNAYEPTEGFPVDENGESVNDRDYKRDRDAQRIVRDMADSYDGRALQSPVIVSKDGVVLSGNNRTMSGEIAARQGTDKAYVAHLREFGAMFGFTPEQIDGMQHPRVVFVPDEELPYDANTFARFNAEQQKKQSKPEHAVKLGKIVPDNVFTSIVGDISRFDRMSDYYADGKAAASAISQLLDAGVINEMQLPELRTGNALSAAGKELIENTLIGKVFQTSPDAVRQIISTPTLRQSVVMGLNEIANNRTLAKSGYDLSKELAAAVDLVSRAKAEAPEIYKEGMPVSPYGRQQGLFDDEYGDSRVTDGVTLLLADLLNSGKPSDLRKVLSTYNHEAASPAAGLMDMFSGDVPSKEEVLNNVLNHFRNATPKEQQAIVDAAIAERKRRAEAAEPGGGSQGGEQTENAVRGSEETSAENLGGNQADGIQEKLTEEEADAMLDRMKSIADPMPEVELTPENWMNTFGLSNKIDTPIGEVKMGESQYAKLMEKKRSKEFGMVVGTITDPDVVFIEPSSAKDGQVTERAYSYVFVKTFKKEDENVRYYSSVTVSIDGMEISVSSHYINSNKAKKKLLELNRRYTKTALISNSSDGRLAEQQDAVPDLLPTQENNAVSDLPFPKDGVSVGEDTNKQLSLQGNEGKIVGGEGETSLSAQIDAASADVNTDPTEAQKEAGNYKKGHVHVGSFDITIEQPQGSVRKGTDANGKQWESKMNNTYGYFRGTEGVDGDHIDVFLSNDIDGWNRQTVFVVDQYNPDGSFDEHKVMLGFNNAEEAKRDYLANYEKGWENGRRIDVSAVNLADFEKWIASSHRKTKPFSEYSSVKKKGSASSETKQSKSTAEEKPFNAVIEMLRKKFPDASMEALTAADRLLREQALPGERQKAIEAVAKALGLKVEWRDTMEKENGTFNPKTRTITIARDSEHALANTFGHEVTHAVRNLSEADYKNLKDAVRRLYSFEKEYNEAVQAYGDMYTGLDFDALEEELIADNIGFMIGGRNDMTQELASRMNHRVLWAIHDAMNKVRNALAKVLHIDSKKNGLLEAIDSARDTIRETMANAQRIAKEKGQGLSNESGSARQSLRTQDSASEFAEQYGLDEADVAMRDVESSGKVNGDTPLLDVDGKPIVVKTDDGKVELNLRTWQDEKQKVRDALLDGGLEPEAVDAMMAQAETIASGMSGLLDKYPLFGAWQKVAATNRSILRNNNGGYLSFDYSFNCVKKDALNAVMEALVANGKGAHLGVTQVEALKKVLQKHGFLTPCVMCYVEAKRKVYKQSKEMAAKWNAVAETVGLNGEEMGAERELGTEQRHALAQLANGENLDSVKGFAAHGGDGIKKDTIVKIAKLMLDSAKLRGRMNYEWMMSPNSYTEMYNKFGDTGLMELMSQGQSRGKALLEASPFSFKSIPSDLMTGMYNPLALANLGGVRQFSYEDARAVMFFDYYTQFLVMQGARAPEHLYTKRPFMPEMFGRTGAMMNQSLIVDIWRGEEWHKKALGLSDKDYDEWLTAHAGFVPRGALPKGHTLYEEGSTELVPNWGVESFPVDIAMKNVHNKDYKGTVGNVVVAPNREFILWALDNPDIHMVLAYHAKGANPLMKSLTGYDRAEAMDDGYHTYDKDGKGVSELSVPETGLEIHGGALQWNLLLRRNGYDARKAAQVYLDYCKEHGLTPMFCYDGVVDMSGERATSHPEYYKLLTDFRVYDEDGNSIRQRAVKAVLPENWQVILDKYLQQESSLSGKVGNIRLDEGLMNEINAVTRFASIESGERDTLTKLLTSIYGKGNVQVLATREFDAALDEVTDRGHAQMLRDNGGTVYGFAVGDRIVLNEDLFNANTPMHEHTHVYMKVLKATNPRLYNRGMELWRDTPLWNQAKRGLEALGEEPTDDRIFSECMSQFTGAENEKIISEVTGITDKNWLQKAMSWLSEMWKGVKSAFARWTQKDLDGLTAEQFGRMPLRAVYDAKERKAYTERVEQVFGDGGASAHDVVAKHEALTKPTAGPREAERMEIKQSLRDGTFIQSGSYFSGGGLLEEGLKNYLDPKVAVEFNSKISGVYADNHGRHIVTADVRDVDPATLVGQLDSPVEYFHASPVCKNFSRAKREAGEVELDKETARSTADFIKANHPKVVTIENVKGYRDSEALKIITDELSRQGYDWDMDVYNAADFGGYTSRERLIVRAVRDGELPPKPKAIAKEDRKKGWMEAVSDLIPTLHEKRSGVPEWMDSRLKAEGIDWHNIDKPLYVFGQGNNKNSVPHAFADELLPTLRTKGGDVIIMPDGRVLRAEPRVLARVTGLSDDYHMPITDDLAHTIVGNGIPAQLSQGVIGPLLEGVFNGVERVTDDVKASKRGEERHAIVASAIEDGTYMKAPNGEDSNLDEENWVDVRTKEFKDWFGDWENDPEHASKVVDENGEPLVVYHDTNSTEFVNVETGEIWDDLGWREKEEWKNRDDFDDYWEERPFYTFDNKSHGRRSIEMPAFFFTPNYDEYHEYGERTIAAFLNIKNPVKNPEIPNSGATDTAGEDAMNHYIEQGYDGFIREYDGIVDEINAFFPNQIKSAEENNGDYSRSDNDIRHSLRGMPIKPNSAEVAKREAQTKPSAGPREAEPKTLKGKEALAALDNIFRENAASVMPETVSSLERFKDLFRRPIRTFLGELVKVKDEVWNKILRNNRQDITGTVLPTIENADFAIRDTDGSTLYVKRFESERSGNLYNIVVVNKHGEVEDYVSSVHIKRDGNLRNKIKNGAELFLPQERNTDGTLFRNNSAPTAKVVKTDGLSQQSNEKKQSRRGTPNLYPDHIAQAIYEQSVNGFKFDLDEAWHDSLLSVKRLQEAISETRGVPIRDFENVYWHAVALSSVNAAEMEQLMNLRIQPFIEAVQDICKKHDLTQEDIEVYLNCKHGLERNEAMARRAAEKQVNEEFKDELRKAERAAAKDPLDQDAADALDDVKQRMNDREEELYFENREKDYSGLTDIFDPKDKVTGDRLDLTVSELEDKAKKCVDDFENKVGVVDVSKLWDNIHELNNYSLRKSYLSGLISKSQYDSVKQMYQWYVPLRGFNEEVAGDVYTYVTRGETRNQQLLKEAKGRTSRAGDILATMMNMANSAVNQGNRNLMKQKILNLALNAKSPLLSVSSTWYQTDANGFDVPIEPPINDQMTPSEQKDAIEQWEDTMEMLAKQGKVHRMSDNLRLNLRTQKWQADEHCIRVQRGGKEYCVWVNGNPRAAQALNDRLGNQVTKPYKATETILDKAEDLFTDGFIKIFRYMAQSVTSLNPEFVISNFQRDLASASLVSTGKYGVGYTKDFLVNVKRLGVLTGTMSHKKEYRNAAGIYTLYSKYKSGNLDNNNEMERYFAEFMQNGGETGYTQSLSIKDYQSRIQSALGDKGFVKWSKNAGHAVADFVEMANRGVENTCRFAAYMTSRQHGKSVLQAIVDAKEASTNFNLHGAGGFGNAWLRKSIIFINPAVQSIVQYCQLTAKHPKAMLSMLGGTILLGAAMAFACARMVAPGGGDPDSNYWDLSDYVRHNYIVIPSGNGNWTRIALPPEIRAVYGLGVIAMEAALGRMNHSSIPAAIGDQLMQFSPVAFLDPRNFFNRSDSDHSVGKTLIKAFTPTLASPIADAYIWDEDFMGRQITGKNDFNDDKPEFQRVSYDTLPLLVSFSRWLNNISGGNDYKKGWVNINPSAAGYVASQYIGGPLQFVTKIGKTVAMITYEDLRDMRNVPFLSRFMTSTDNDYGRNQVSNAEFKYWSAIADDVRTQIRGFEKEIESGDTKNLDDYKKLVSSKEYEMYQMIDYMDWLKDIRELNQKRKEETTQDAQKQVTLEIYEVRRKMAECLNKAEEMGVYLEMSQLNLELANAKTTEERAAIQAKINEKRKENLKKIGAIE